MIGQVHFFLTKRTLVHLVYFSYKEKLTLCPKIKYQWATTSYYLQLTTKRESKVYTNITTKNIDNCRK